MEKPFYLLSAVFLDSFCHKLLEFFGGSFSKAIFVNDDIAVLIAEQEVVGPGFDAGEFEKTVFAVTFARGLVHDVFVDFHFAGDQEIFAVFALQVFDLILRHVFVVAVK